MSIVRVLVGLGSLLTLTACPKQEFPVNAPISFLADVSITPSRRTIQRGDTLWLEARFSDSLLERNSGKRYRVRPQDLKFTSYIAYQQLVGVGQNPVGIARTFRILEQVGKAPVGGSNSGVFEPVYDGHSYRARIGLIPTKPCVTAISLLLGPEGGTKKMGQILSFIQLPPTATGQRQQAVLNTSYYVINKGKANNLDLYSQHTRAFSLEPGVRPEDALYETHSTFTVEVR